jgi:superfamily II DNA helicase RecQ
VFSELLTYILGTKTSSDNPVVFLLADLVSLPIQAVKEKIKMNMQDPDGQIIILVATSATGMGVNNKGVNNVIHFDPPKDMDSFVKKLGRAGRESNQHAMAMLLCNGRQCRNLDGDMKCYIESENICRRGVMLAAYNATHLPDRVKHLCCDNCTGSCKCGSGDCGTFEHLYNKVKLPEFSSGSESDSDDNSSEFFH